LPRITFFWYIFTMHWQSLRSDVPLGAKPTLLWMDVGIHGPEEWKRYRFEGLWILHLYLYAGRIVIDDVEFPIRPGYASLMPPGATSTTYFPELSRHLFAHFTLPAARKNLVPIPMMQDLGAEFLSLHEAFEQVIAYASVHLLRAEVRMWDILWQLADKSVVPVTDPQRRHPAVHQAIEIIERRLAEPIRVPDLAGAVDLSHNHLTRLFHAATGLTIVEYIQNRRIQRARHLLVHSTLPIKAIAEEVGIRDLHHFNKVIRKALGEAPRRVRARGPEME
jgi:AraC family transcriptional regulator